MLRFALFALLTSFLAFPAAAGDPYKIDNGHSTVMFRIKHMKTAYFYGRFRTVSGTVDWSDPAKAKIRVDIDPASVYTGIKKRDQHIMSPDFLDTAQFPKMSFESTSVAATKDPHTFKVTGKLTAHGVTKEVSFDIKHTGNGDNGRGHELIGGWAQFTFKRSDFGMTKMLDKLGDEIQLTISIEAMRPKAK